MNNSRYIKLKNSYLKMLFIIGFGLLGCQKDEKNEDFESTIHGRYEIISALSNTAVDLNFDGNSNINLLKEIPELSRSFLELKLKNIKKPYLFTQEWQNQHISKTNSNKANEDNFIVLFANQATVASFALNENNTQLILFRKKNDDNFPLPELVEIVGYGQIRVVLNKLVLTKEGQKTISIEIRYKRILVNF